MLIVTPHVAAQPSPEHAAQRLPPPDVSGGRALRLDRNSRLDACRVAASIAILWMHSWESGHRGQVGEVGRFGVPFFTLSAFYLLTQSLYRRPDRSFPAYAADRFVRLYLPFLAWGAMGLLGKILKHRFISHVPRDPVGIDFFVDGESFQLWFLPFLFIFSLIFFPICRRAVQLSDKRRRTLAIILILAGFAEVFIPGWNCSPGSSWFGFYMVSCFSIAAYPSIVWGIAAALWLKQTFVPAWLGWLGLGATFAGMAFSELAPYRHILLENVCGLVFFLFAISGSGGGVSNFLSRYSFLAYGIYLSQNVVLEPLQAALTYAKLPQARALELAVFCFVLLGTSSLSVLLSRHAMTRWLIGLSARAPAPPVR